MSTILDINKVNERLCNRTWKCIEWKGRHNDNRLVCSVCKNEYIGQVEFIKYPPKCSCEWGLNVKEELDKHNCTFISFDKKYRIKCNECEEEYAFTKQQIKNKKYLCYCERYKEYEKVLKENGFNYKITKSDIKEKVNVKCLDCKEEFIVRLQGLVPNDKGRIKRVCECKKALKPLTLEEVQERINKSNANLTIKEWNGATKYASALCGECGALVETDYGQYLYTKDKYGFTIKRCSCKKIISKGEEKIAMVLKDLEIDFLNEKKFEDLRGDSNRCLSYDFYIPSLNTLIEYDGEFHFRNDNKEKLRKQQKYDEKKTEYANENNINLIRIPYWEYDNIEKILKKLKIGT